MLSEKWIAEAIQNEMAKVLFSDDPADWDWTAVAMVAAHAIYERLAEGVIGEMEGRIVVSEHIVDFDWEQTRFMCDVGDEFVDRRAAIKGYVVVKE